MNLSRTAGKILLKKLVEHNIITANDMNTIDELCKNSGRSAIEALAEVKQLEPDEIPKLIAKTTDLPYVKLDRYQPSNELVNKFSIDIVKKYRFVPVTEDGEYVVIATDSLLTLADMDELRKQSTAKLKVVMTDSVQLETAIDKHFSEIDKEAIKAVESVLERSHEDSEVHFEEAVVLDGGGKIPKGVDQRDIPVIKLVNNILANSIKRRASDIHLEAEQKYTLLRYRIDGVLFDSDRFPKYFHSPLISRLKILAGLNVAERRLPQNGHFHAIIAGKKIDFRVSTIPTLFGEKCVLRALDRTYTPQDIKNLGLNEEQLNQLYQLLDKPHGIILVSGPTGSGKTTTLYAAIEHLNERSMNIVTIEDPVEYNKDGINQIQVFNQIGLTFETALENILRQDPDVIMLGEIRSKDSATIAMRAALTGHLLLSSIHTNSAIDTITRLLDLGIEPYLVATCLTGCIAQRLVRKVCEKCAAKKKIPEYERKSLPAGLSHLTTQFVGTGCAYCNHIGYRGRAAVFEILPITDELRKLIHEGRISELHAAVKKSQFVTLKEHLAYLVTKGITTADEAVGIVY